MTDPSHHQDTKTSIEPATTAISVDDDLLMAGDLPMAANSTVAEQVHSPQETIWLHIIFFSMAVAVIGASFLLRSEGPDSVFLPGTEQAMPELCVSRRIFGLPCPGCGLTRSFISISQGQLSRAWRFNPVSFLLYPFIFIQIPWNAMQYWLIRKRGYGVQLPYVHFLPIAIAVILLLRWLTLVPQIIF